MSAIEIKNLSVHYGSVCALQNVNLIIENNEFVGIIGPNGGGKTTLIKVILGLLKHSGGNIKINNNAKIGYVPQFTAFDRNFPINVLDVVLMGGLSNKIKIFKRHSKNDILYAKSIMEKLDILKFKDRQIGQLSGGQLQKVLIARALFSNPKILILDEPTASIDSKTKKEIYELLKELNKEKTILIVSHDMEDIFHYIDSVICVNKTLHYHGNDKKLDKNTLEKVYGCPVNLFLDNDKKISNREDRND